MTSQQPTGHDKAVEWLARALSIPDWGEPTPTSVYDHDKWTWDGDHRTKGERDMYRDLARHSLAAVRAALAAGDPDVAEALDLPLERITEHTPHYGSFNEHRCGDPTEPCRTYDIWRIRTDWREA